MGEMKEELKANEARLRAANDVMKADMEKMSAALAESSAKMSQLEGAGARKRHFLSHLYIKINILPRQARDKHRENSKKVPFSQEEAKRTMLKNEATMRALHVIQKIMARPDAQDVFKRCAPFFCLFIPGTFRGSLCV
jgi:hypothetical protein